MFFGIGKVLWKAQEIIGRDIEECADGFDVFQTGFIFVVLHIGNLSLGHIDLTAQVCLIQFPVFTQKPEFFTKS